MTIDGVWIGNQIYWMLNSELQVTITVSLFPALYYSQSSLGTACQCLLSFHIQWLLSSLSSGSQLCKFLSLCLQWHLASWAGIFLTAACWLMPSNPVDFSLSSSLHAGWHRSWTALTNLRMKTILLCHRTQDLLRLRLSQAACLWTWLPVSPNHLFQFSRYSHGADLTENTAFNSNTVLYDSGTISLLFTAFSSNSHWTIYFMH